jgi:hypothetical protein
MEVIHHLGDPIGIHCRAPAPQSRPVSGEARLSVRAYIYCLRSCCSPRTGGRRVEQSKLPIGPKQGPFFLALAY